MYPFIHQCGPIFLQVRNFYIFIFILQFSHLFVPTTMGLLYIQNKRKMLYYLINNSTEARFINILRPIHFTLSLLSIF